VKAEDGIRDRNVTGVQTCALPICKADVSRWQSRWITGSFPYKVKLVFRKYVNRSIINKNANFNSFRKKVNFFLLRYNQDKKRKRSEERRVGKECKIKS